MCALALMDKREESQIIVSFTILLDYVISQLLIKPIHVRLFIGLLCVTVLEIIFSKLMVGACTRVLHFIIPYRPLYAALIDCIQLA